MFAQSVTGKISTGLNKKQFVTKVLNSSDVLIIITGVISVRRAAEDSYLRF